MKGGYGGSVDGGRSEGGVCRLSKETLKEVEDDGRGRMRREVLVGSKDTVMRKDEGRLV